jgi:hypothetical protein
MSQSAKHASLLAALGAGFEGYGYEAAFMAYWDSLGTVAAGTFNERMLSWINGVLSVTHNNLPSAMQAYAVSKSAYNWDSLGDLALPE